MSSDNKSKEINEFLNRRIDNVYPSKKELEKLLRSGKKLRIYQGFDPSKPNLHIGHLVGLLTLREFQKLGHEVIFLIGDFTGMVGDPTGKLEARKILSPAQVKENAKTYQDQAGLVLPFKGENPVKLKFNSQWNSKLDLEQVLRLASHLTVRQLIERDMFDQRIKDKKEIFLNEFLYPLIQGYDSVAMEVDLEVGGSDQLFNMLIGRKLVKEMLGKEKLVATTKLLVDSSGRKIGKTEGNAINLVNPANEFFGQIMNLGDDSISSCLKLITDLSLAEIEKLEREFKNQPMELKKILACEILKLLRGEKAARNARAEFERVFQKKEMPTETDVFFTKNSRWQLLNFLVKSKLCPSRSEGKRIIRQGGVEVDGKTASEIDQWFETEKETIIKLGKKKWLKVVYTPSRKPPRNFGGR